MLHISNMTHALFNNEHGFSFQGEAPASLAIGTHVSAKYKGAFCEAKVHSVNKQVKVRVTFKNGLGSTTLSDELQVVMNKLNEIQDELELLKSRSSDSPPDIAAK